MKAGMSPVMAQNARQIHLSDSLHVVDELRFRPDSTECDIHVDFVFNENDGTVSVEMENVSSMLFGFRRSVPYKSVFKRGGKLRLGKIPYKVEVDRHLKFKVVGRTRRGLNKNYRDGIMRPWIVYDGVDQAPSKYVLPDQTLKQTFKLRDGRDSLTLTIRDVFTLKHKEGKWTNVFIMPDHQDFVQTYQVFVHRNPCRSSAPQIAAIQAERAELSAALQELVKIVGDGVLKSDEEFALYTQKRNALLKKYAKKDASVACKDLADAASAFNASLDSLIDMNVKLPQRNDGDVVLPFGAARRQIDVATLTNCARLLDDLVTSWKMTDDKLTKRSIVQQCEHVIAEAEDQAVGNLATTPEQKKAVALFISAMNYYKRVCK